MQSFPYQGGAGGDLLFGNPLLPALPGINLIE